MKKIICMVLTFIIFCSQSCFALECRFLNEKNYDRADDFIHDIAIVSENNQTAVIDRMGNTVIDFDYREKKIRGNGLIMITGEDDKAAFFDKNGKQLTDYVYDTYPVTNPKTGETTYHMSVSDGDGKSDLIPYSREMKFGYINPYGTEVTGPVFDYAYGFVNNVALICADGILSEYGTYTNCKYGFIYDNGEVIIAPDSYHVATHVSDFGYSTATNGPGSEIILDRNYNVSATDQTGFGAVDVKYIKVCDDEGRIGIYDKNRNPVIKPDFYDSVELLCDDYFIINQSYIINNHNQITYTAPYGVKISPHYTGVYTKSMFARLVKNVDGTFGKSLYSMVTCWGDVVSDTWYDSMYDLKEGLIYASLNGKNYLLDYFGNQLCELNGGYCGYSNNGIFSIQNFETGKKTYMHNPLVHPAVFINDQKLVSDVHPEIENNRTLVPMRAVFESLGAEIIWDDDTQTVHASKNNTEISLQIGSSILYKNGVQIEIDVPAKLKYDRTLVPLRAVSEALDAKVDWDEENKIVNIKYE